MICFHLFCESFFRQNNNKKQKNKIKHPETILTKNPSLMQQQLNPQTNSSLKATDYKLHNCEVSPDSRRSSLLSKEIAQELNPKLMEVLKMML